MRDYPKTNKRIKPSSRKILVTAGPTVEPLDPVRYISNLSTGTFGYEIAGEALRRGFKVCLVSGPVDIHAPKKAELISVTTADEMHKEITKRIKKYDCIIMTAAVCDFRPKRTEKQKIKKKDKLTLELVKNKDILSGVSSKKNLVKVGFALETDSPIKNAKTKLKEKKLDFIVVNTIGRGPSPFGKDPSLGRDYAIIDSNCNVSEFNKVTKKQIAKIILSKVETLVK